MSDILMILGAFRFSVSTAAPDDVSHETRWDWKAVDRVGSMPALQYTGPQNDTMTLNGRLFTGVFGGREQLAQMRFQADQGLPLPLVDGTGRVHGLWVIEGVDDTGTNHFRDGEAKKITFSISLKKYSDGTGVFGALTKISKLVSLIG